MSERKYTSFDRMLLAGMVMQSAAVGNDTAQAKMAVRRADALLARLAEESPPSCVDPDAPSVSEQLSFTLDNWLSRLVHILTYAVPR